MKNQELRALLNRKAVEYNHPSFIAADPISIPHRFSKKQDIEIAGLFAAVFAWGNRKTIIQKSGELMDLMQRAPHDFCLRHEPKDLKKLLAFKHRTFNSTDLLYFIDFLRSHYTKHDSLEDAFLREAATGKHSVRQALTLFAERFFSLEHAPQRTRKHIASPQNNSTCKRLNMYLRWMVRRDDNGVDFGLWERLSPASLIMPIDLHVSRVAKRFGLVKREQNDWITAMELTRALRRLDRNDPVKYDFALFGLGAIEKY